MRKARNRSVYRFLVCPDCGYDLFSHRMMGTSQPLEYSLRNTQLKQTCRAVLVRDPLTGEHQILSQIEKAVKRIPIGKRREKNRQTRPTRFG